ncbi:transcription factor JunD-like [Pseudoliparis swirei]|uniref:transcription factor JunD-like n=1 Tax=Pseudoliparis swirei TaxID=2059687 RepID=UPI0024BEA678|nr:transcription factor JunD-like [Pseudoliparis swirei]
MMKKDIHVSLAHDADLKPHLRDAAADSLLLCSPDLGLLKLASPELERLIIQSNGMVTTSPTLPQFLYPKAGADEQEFAEGFVKALEDLHKQNQLSGGAAAQSGGGLELCASLQGPVPVQPDHLPVYTNLNSYGGGTLDNTVHYSADAVPEPCRVQPLKEEPQTVPDVQSFGESPPMSPIDIDVDVDVDTDSHDNVKAERKRLRNRIAASKCRMRKLERISRLEDKVKSLKNHNTDLASTADLLRDQVAHLKQRVLTHVNSGCQVLPHEVQVH